MHKETKNANSNFQIQIEKKKSEILKKEKSIKCYTKRIAETRDIKAKGVRLIRVILWETNGKINKETKHDNQVMNLQK